MCDVIYDVYSEFFKLLQFIGGHVVIQSGELILAKTINYSLMLLF